MNAILLPDKHIYTTESLLGLGALVLASLEQSSKSLDALWSDLKRLDVVKQRAHGSVSLDSVVLAIDFLFAIGAITHNNKGFLEYAST